MSVVHPEIDPFFSITEIEPSRHQELRKDNDNVITENIKLEAENIKLKQSLEEHESRFMKLEQNDKNTAVENAELKARVTKLERKQSHTDDAKEVLARNALRI
ncbi:9360_t:CDS:2 [Paraglomus occultum]|uniref:9360_t:CDS:1 n=1 Tax=Paraglomus occultum TaxID=144539 RepID=A0A9N8ZCA7_9GLOM|nr:9360_t:CDS:2 [Paraglomus occultum]